MDKTTRQYAKFRPVKRLKRHYIPEDIEVPHRHIVVIGRYVYSDIERCVACGWRNYSGPWQMDCPRCSGRTIVDRAQGQWEGREEKR